MLSFLEACIIIENEILNFEINCEKVSIEDAINRTIAESLIADVDLPSFNNSAVDGIAVKYEDGTTKWKISDEISAGNFNDSEYKDSVEIMTGAKLPEIFDTVIPLEDYRMINDSAVLNENAKICKGMNVRYKASDAKVNEVIISKNTFLTARNISGAVSCGSSEINVYKKLIFGILATGDELIPINETPKDDKLRVSNNYGLSAAVTLIHQQSINFGFINDDYNKLKNKLKEMLKSECDILITTGGVSVGKYDYVKEIFSELGVDEIFWKVYIKPGKPIFFGKYENNGMSKLIFALPGNPVSSLVNFDVLVKPSILKKYSQPQPLKFKAILKNDIKKNDAKRHFVSGIIDVNKNEVITHSSQSSGNLAGFSKSNCLVEINEKTLNPKNGDIVECIMI
ncbi:MAG: molybdopterin molybdotransferase MoeA [Ignavibacteriales bacterium]|nr:molybdopterin molybdotransferase MoeA [Ignavibacteriales bacterium]